MFSEKHVVILSGTSGVLSLIICIATAVAWSYWSNTLNNCSHSDCECILFGEARGTSFVGGTPIWCRSITYSTLIYAVISFGVAAYYIIKLRTTQPKTNFNRAVQTEDNLSQHRYLLTLYILTRGCYFYLKKKKNFSIPRALRVYTDTFVLFFPLYGRFGVCRNKAQFPVFFKLAVGFMALLMFIEASSLHEGYAHSCKEYRSLVVKFLKVSCCHLNRHGRSPDSSISEEFSFTGERGSPRSGNG